MFLLSLIMFLFFSESGAEEKASDNVANDDIIPAPSESTLSLLSTTRPKTLAASNHGHNNFYESATICYMKIFSGDESNEDASDAIFKSKKKTNKN